MRLGPRAESLLEWLLLPFNVGPTPLLDTMVAMLLSRTLMAAVQLGIFEALARQELTAAEIAESCSTDLAATEKLLFALVGCRYLGVRSHRYSLRPVARKWLLRNSPLSLHDATLQRYLDLRLMGHCEAYLLTGSPVRFHENLTQEEWGVYQRGQRSHALYTAPELSRRIPLRRRRILSAAEPPRRKMLDIGGGHGLYSAALCRRHPDLTSVILDLPSALPHALPLLEREGLGARVRFQEGDALFTDLGEEQYDLVLAANLVHHFSEEQNRNLMQRAARALRPGGIVAVLEIIRGATGQVGSLTDLYFAVTSQSGTWSFAELSSWQEQAGLQPQRPVRLRFSPGYGIQIARKRQ